MVSLKQTTNEPWKNIGIIAGNLWVGTWIKQFYLCFIFHNMLKKTTYTANDFADQFGFWHCSVKFLGQHMFNQFSLIHEIRKS